MSANLWLWKDGLPRKTNGGTIFHPNLELIERLQPERITLNTFLTSAELGEHERLPGTYTRKSASMVVTNGQISGSSRYVDLECVDPKDGKKLYNDFLAGRARPVDVFGDPQYRPTALVARELVVAIKDLVVELLANARNGIRKGLNWILRKK